MAVRCNENDKRLLSIFKQGVVDPKDHLSSWAVEDDCCSWVGVHCDNITGRVMKLDLFNHAFGGEINLSLLRLEFLNHLDLSSNDFITVSMSPCQFSKSPVDGHKFDNHSLATPSNQSENFSVSLRFLDFSDNFKLVISDLHWLSQLTSLKYLDLSGNDIGNETKWLHYMAMLPSLSELHLRFCQLSNFPSLDYANFTSLEVLDLSSNFDTKSKLPYSLFNVTNHIYHLDLSGCNFFGELPLALLNLEHLQYLHLGFNNLEGSIPYWLGQFERLQYFDISDNMFNGSIPSSLGNISSLISLHLSSNHLSGSLPESLAKLLNLNHLHIGHNFLVGVLTEKNFSNFSNLTSLDLSSTSFKFDIDPQWILPFQLEELDMSNTSIGPNVPTWIYTQRSLEHLYISRSGISTIDADVFWSFVAGIDYIDLSHNLISEDISNITVLANVSSFFASHNSLSGSIFSLSCHLESDEESKLSALDLSHNHLSGALPDCWSNWKQLRFLGLGSNKLTDLECLNLEQNKFSGSLPNTIQQNMMVIKLKANQFTGNIPSQMCNLSSLRILDLAVWIHTSLPK
ncbi:receptor-like protein EIX2 isoform X2 [Prosopis cineraria]|uniref:receptor-like protein EIX2 isoform X2 n=1 Tax=Prosopis cineraria TaxID=364024 RepID=UPI00240F55D3|nr:receptor-like protein EIX2 isoform X2 [Prosopis cineraria]